jgi:hypothetical protein
MMAVSSAAVCQGYSWTTCIRIADDDAAAAATAADDDDNNEILIMPDHDNGKRAELGYSRIVYLLLDEVERDMNFDPHNPKVGNE